MKNQTSAEEVVPALTTQELLQLLEVNKELLAREKEKELLYNIASAIANIKDRISLMKFIMAEVKSIFNFYDVGLAVLDKDGDKGVDWAIQYPEIDPAESNYNSNALNLAKAPYKNSLLEKSVLEVEAAGHPLVYKINEQLKNDNPDLKELLQAEISFGIKETLFTYLKCGNKIVGTFNINSLTDGHFQASQFHLFQAVADLIAVAVANILANEEILEREKEKSQLLEISEAIATVQNSKQLLKVIYEKIRPVFEYDNAGLFILNKTENEYYEMVDNKILSDEIQDELTMNNLLGPFSLQDVSENFWIFNKEPVISTIQQQANYVKNISGKIQYEIGIKHGLKHMIGGQLNCAGKKIGNLCFNTKKENFYQQKHLSLFKSIADLIAIAVANILSNEEIVEREREKELLYNIASAIANIKDRTSLMKFILNEVKHIFNFYDVGMVVLNPDGVDGIDWAVDMPQIDPSSSNHELNKKGLLSFPYKNSLLEKSVKKVQSEGNPLIVKFEEELMVAYPDLKSIMEIEMSHGHKEALFTYLKCGDKIIGTFNLNSLEDNHFQASQFHLFQAVADLIAVAVANILANEEILEREKEKTQLLEITELIAQVKDNHDLLRLIVSKIKPIFNFHDCGLFILDTTGKTHTDLAAVIPDVSPSAWNQLIASVSEKIEHTHSPVEWMMARIEALGKPIVFDFVEMAEKFPSYPQIDGTGILELGYRDCLAFNLKIRGKNIGLFCINALQKDFFSPAVFPIFQSVTESISIAVANILANEELLEREKEKSILLSISEDIASIRDSGQLFKMMTERLDAYMDFDHAVIMHLDKEKNNYQHLFSTIPGFQSSLRPHEQPAYPVTSTMAAMIKTGNFKICHIEALLKKNPSNRGLAQLDQLGICELMAVPLKYAGDILGFLMLYSKRKATYTKENTTFIVAASLQLSVAVSNVLAYEALKENADEIGRLNKQLQAQNAYLVQEVEQVYNFEEMIGQNPKFEDVCRNISLVANTDSTVLILGETGTGKELVARAIHNNSPRKNKPLIKLNCAALPANLIESELFGHERGAFTGAVDKRIGKFELAHGSTLFLDEVGELPLELQAKLLRALQEKEIERLGSNKTLQIDVRIIAATNRDLLKEVQAGTFRQDLYYRLHIFPITLPPLRERKEDIPLLALHFIERYAKKMGKKIQGFSSNAMQEMMRYNWPGNIRELEHVIERCVILSQTKLIDELNLPDVAKNKTAPSSREFVLKTWEQQERDYIMEVLKITNGNVKGKGGAAELLQLAPSTLQSKMLKLGIKRKHYSE